MNQEYKDRLAQLRTDRDKFKRLSAERRRDAAELRKERRFLEALKAMDRCSEYRESADKAQAEMNRIKALFA